MPEFRLQLSIRNGLRVRDQARTAMIVIAWMMPWLIATANTVTLTVEGKQARAVQGAKFAGDDIEILGGTGAALATFDIHQPGDYQIWIRYRYPGSAASHVSIRVRSQDYRVKLQSTLEEDQYFLHYVGTVSIPSGGQIQTTTSVDSSAEQFLFHGLELTKSPVLEPELESLFNASVNFYDRLQRSDHGLYRDVYLHGKRATRNHNRICSTAAIGVGLISLCMRHELGIDLEAESKALQTLKSINGKTAGFRMDREAAGFFRHFIDARSGTGKSEFSTIDTAIMVVGALFCRNTFEQNSEISNEADQLWNSIDWPLAIADRNAGELYMVFVDGKPDTKSVTTLFNEYYILAWLIQQYETQTKGKSDLLDTPLPRTPFRDMTLLCSRSKRPQCSFIIQFPFYMCHPCTRSPLFFSFVGAQARADQITCFDRVGKQAYWGCGAGGTPYNGYFASHYENNPDNVVSPRIIAGFIPVYPVAQDHLLQLYRDPSKRLKTPAGDLLPRFSVDDAGWRHHRIEAIDLASMMFGLAAVHPNLGMKFFHEKSRMTFRSSF